jgi:hypothetical protein
LHHWFVVSARVSKARKARKARQSKTGGALKTSIDLEKAFRKGFIGLCVSLPNMMRGSKIVGERAHGVHQ